MDFHFAKWIRNLSGSKGWQNWGVYRHRCLDIVVNSWWSHYWPRRYGDCVPGSRKAVENVVLRHDGYEKWNSLMMPGIHLELERLGKMSYLCWLRTVLLIITVSLGWFCSSSSRSMSKSTSVSITGFRPWLWAGLSEFFSGHEIRGGASHSNSVGWLLVPD